MRETGACTALLALLCALASGISGCIYTRAQTDSARTATEQLLLTQSVEQAVADLELPDLSGRDVAVEVVSLAGSDAAYLEAAMRERLRRDGAQLVDLASADVVLRFFVGALGTVSRGLEFGIPAVALGAYATPSLPFVRILKQRGYTKLRVVAHDGDGRYLEQRGPVMRRASFELYGVLLFAMRRNDIYPGEELEFSVD